MKTALGSETLNDFLPLGHGAALTLPDQPWAEWHYENGLGKEVQRNNLSEFMQAADMAYRVIRAFIDGEMDFVNQTPLPGDVATTLKDLLSRCQLDDGEQRLSELMKAVTGHAFPGIAAIPGYVPTGEGSWKAQATGLCDDDEDTDPPVWDPVRFEDSHYRRFHDAVKEHRNFLANEVLPKHELRIA